MRFSWEKVFRRKLLQRCHRTSWQLISGHWERGRETQAPRGRMEMPAVHGEASTRLVHGEASTRSGLMSFRMNTCPGCHGGSPAWMPGQKGGTRGNTGHSSGVGRVSRQGDLSHRDGDRTQRHPRGSVTPAHTHPCLLPLPQGDNSRPDPTPLLLSPASSSRTGRSHMAAVGGTPASAHSLHGPRVPDRATIPDS